MLNDFSQITLVQQQNNGSNNYGRANFNSNQPTGNNLKRPQPAPVTNNNYTKAVVQVDEDEDFDISDSELIRASQVVESQLKFTNNVHHTTSNALNIFSQFNSTSSSQSQFNSNMGPPQSAIFQTQSTNNHHIYDSVDSATDLTTENKKLRAENMQKDGEVKILRDKIKRQEQETQRTRREKEDTFKLYQKEKNADRSKFQKEIEIKAIEAQFKDKEIMDLTMKNKVRCSCITLRI